MQTSSVHTTLGGAVGVSVLFDVMVVAATELFEDPVAGCVWM